MSERNSDLLGVMLRVLLLIHKHPGISRKTLSHEIGVSDQVISRQIKILRVRFAVEIKSAPRYGYSLISWGIFRRENFLEKYDIRHTEQLKKSDSENSGKACPAIDNRFSTEKQTHLKRLP